MFYFRTFLNESMILHILDIVSEYFTFFSNFYFVYKYSFFIKLFMHYLKQSIIECNGDIFMKVFFIRKNYIIMLIFILIVSAFFVFFFQNFNSTFAIEFSKNGTLSDDMISKISDLTKGTEKVAFLTFDDGPNVSVTPKVLDILKDKNVKASFFVIGKNVDSHPEIVKRAYDEGHFIANHGYDHNNSILYKNSESFINEIKKTDLAIGNAIGVQDYCSHVFRFPNGFMSPNNKAKKKEAVKLLRDMNYTYIDWNCLNNDSMKKYNNYQLLNNLKKTCKGKDTLVILMHDTKDVSNSSNVLKESIDYLRSEGYIFKNFYDIL